MTSAQTGDAVPKDTAQWLAQTFEKQLQDAGLSAPVLDSVVRASRDNGPLFDPLVQALTYTLISTFPSSLYPYCTFDEEGLTIVLGFGQYPGYDAQAAFTNYGIPPIGSYEDYVHWQRTYCEHASSRNRVQKVINDGLSQLFATPLAIRLDWVDGRHCQPTSDGATVSDAEVQRFRRVLVSGLDSFGMTPPIEDHMLDPEEAVPFIEQALVDAVDSVLRRDWNDHRERPVVLSREGVDFHYAGQTYSGESGYGMPDIEYYSHIQSLYTERLNVVAKDSILFARALDGIFTGTKRVGVFMPEPRAVWPTASRSFSGLELGQKPLNYVQLWECLREELHSRGQVVDRVDVGEDEFMLWTVRRGSEDNNWYYQSYFKVIMRDPYAASAREARSFCEVEVVRVRGMRKRAMEFKYITEKSGREVEALLDQLYRSLTECQP